ncbi:unnamed protein product [Oppiella nova]|uniref:AMP-binding enzyme C-terminal domain-containing protein n=1 Tax=Oppiella nova TaxID=334625 RepID=A0A7R9MAV1_9ACAR|nr:unnamed protein product [Oppiella nova]CAG2173915.1 unnamed protein product [Oppiella nova]
MCELNNFVKIDPDELAEFLMSHKGVDDAVVVGVNNNIGLHWLRAYVVVKKGHTIPEGELEKYVQDNKPNAVQLRGGVEFVDMIHTTYIGNTVRKYYRNIVNSDLTG